MNCLNRFWIFQSSASGPSEKGIRKNIYSCNPQFPEKTCLQEQVIKKRLTLEYRSVFVDWFLCAGGWPPPGLQEQAAGFCARIFDLHHFCVLLAGDGRRLLDRAGPPAGLGQVAAAQLFSQHLLLLNITQQNCRYNTLVTSTTLLSWCTFQNWM